MLYDASYAINLIERVDAAKAIRGRHKFANHVGDIIRISGFERIEVC